MKALLKKDKMVHKIKTVKISDVDNYEYFIITNKEMKELIKVKTIKKNK